MPDLAMAFKLTSSASRLRKAAFTSTVSVAARRRILAWNIAALETIPAIAGLDLFGHLGQGRSAVMR